MDSARGSGLRSQIRARRALGGGAVAVIAGFAAMAGPGTAVAGAATTATTTFTTPGQYQFIVPVSVSSISVTAVGGAGGTCFQAGGEAASISGTVPVAAGDQLSIGVAGPGTSCGAQGSVPGGIGGGGASGAGFAASGGGASIVSEPQLSPGYVSQLIVAGGGGGSGGGGGAGGNAGAPGESGNGISLGGGAGTATAGGAGGVDNSGFNASGLPGGPFVGGAGGGGPIPSGGGGGGAGFFGGGGGAGTGFTPAAGGGGGSSFLAADATAASGPTVTTAAAGVTITYAAPTADLGMPALTFASQPQNSLSAEQTLSVTNNGSASLIVSGVQTGGTDAGDYLIADGCQQPVTPGGRCQIGVRFSPEAQGASSAMLAILTNAPAAPSPVTLSGTGIAPTTGATGPQGPAGPQGPKGATGAAGPARPAGTIVCRNTLAAKALCTLEFAPGTFKVQGTVKQASFRIEHRGRTVITGTIPVKQGKVSRKKIGKLRPGRYTLIITASLGHNKTNVLLRCTFRVS
jgi:hypothetical protein